MFEIVVLVMSGRSPKWETIHFESIRRRVHRTVKPENDKIMVTQKEETEFEWQIYVKRTPF